MALDASQKAKIRRLLGYPDPSVMRPTQILDTGIEWALDNVSAEGEVEIEAALAAIATIDTALTQPAAIQGLKSVGMGEVVWRDDGPANTLRVERSRYAREIASILGVPFRGAGRRCLTRPTVRG